MLRIAQQLFQEASPFRRTLRYALASPRSDAFGIALRARTSPSIVAERMFHRLAPSKTGDFEKVVQAD